jgi:hypothetical protein
MMEEKRSDARPYFQRAIDIYERALGYSHPTTKRAATMTASLLDELDLSQDANMLRQKFDIE